MGSKIRYYFLQSMLNFKKLAVSVMLLLQEPNESPRYTGLFLQISFWLLYLMKKSQDWIGLMEHQLGIQPSKHDYKVQEMSLNYLPKQKRKMQFSLWSKENLFYITKMSKNMRLIIPEKETAQVHAFTVTPRLAPFTICLPSWSELSLPGNERNLSIQG